MTPKGQSAGEWKKGKVVDCSLILKVHEKNWGGCKEGALRLGSQKRESRKKSLEKTYA